KRAYKTKTLRSSPARRSSDLYDLQPEMSAPELADRVAAALAEEKYNFVVLNSANPDMVGHTGVFEAAVKAVEAVDAGTKKVVERSEEHTSELQSREYIVCRLL